MINQPADQMKHVPNPYRAAYFLQVVIDFVAQQQEAQPEAKEQDPEAQLDEMQADELRLEVL